MLVLFCFGFFFHTVSCGGKFQARRLKVLAKEGHTQARKGQGDESTSMLIGNFYLLVTWPLRKGRTASLFSSSCRLHPFPAACLAPRDHPDPSAVGCRSPSPGSPVPPQHGSGAWGRCVSLQRPFPPARRDGLVPDP